MLVDVGRPAKVPATATGAVLRYPRLTRYPLVVLALGLVGGGTARAENPFAGQPEAAAAGRALYSTACAACHGTNGEGGRGPNVADGRIVRRLRDDDLFRSIQKGVPGTEMIAFPFPEDQIWQLVTFIRSLSAPAFDARVGGDAQAGAAVFHGKGGCVQCHAIAGRGGLLGPDLSTIGLQRSLKHLREAILDPSLRVADGFRPVTVTLRDGRKISGVAKNHSNYAVQVLDAEGRLHLLQQSDWRGVEFGRESPMPADYARRLTPAEIENLLAFLSRQAASRRN
jgi:putative heme-binding domain-containing protein